MSEEQPATARCPGVPIAMAAAFQPLSRTWNQVAKLGEYKGHPAGPFAFESKTFADLIANFKASANRRIPVDYEHKSETLDGNVAQQGAPAVAWVIDLQDRGADGLWGLFEWVDDQAVDQVRTGKYMFLSPAVVFGAKDRVSGETIGPRLTSVALTNHPFLDGMEPLAASETVPVPVPVTQPDVAPVLASLGPDDVHIPTSIGNSKPGKSRGKGKPVSDLKTKLRGLLGLSDADGDDDETMMSAVEKMCGELGSLKAAKQASMRAAAESAVDARIAAGVILASGRAMAVKLHVEDAKAFDALFPAPVAKEPEPKPVAVSADERALLTSRVSPVEPPPPAAAEPDAQADHAAQADAIAQRLMSENKQLTYMQAAVMASRQLKAESDARVAAALAAIRRR